jgi:DNA (cytosine-5)-methyltransferase 1
MTTNIKGKNDTSTSTLPKYNFVDLFCGIGGFHQGLLKINKDNKCVLGCDIDKKARETYLKNYGADTKFIDNIRTLTDYLFSSNEKIKEIEKQIKNRKNYLDKVSKSIIELQNKLSTEKDEKQLTKINKDINTKQKKQKEYEASIASLNTELERHKENITDDKNRELSEKLKLFEEHINSQFPEDVDIICGGFPCQPFSNGGKKLALEDDRGDLFFNIMYLARVKKPKFMFLENVKHLMTVKDGEVLRLILKTLNENGYFVHVNVLSPHQLGVPQQRERVVFSCVRQDLYDAKYNNSQNNTEPLEFGSAIPLALDDNIKQNFTKIFKSTDKDTKDYKISEDLEKVLNIWDEVFQFLEVGEMLTPTILVDHLDKEYFIMNEDNTEPLKDTEGKLIVKPEFEPIFNEFRTWEKEYITKNKRIYYKYKDQWDSWLSRNREKLQGREIYRKLEWQAGSIQKNETIWNHFINPRQSGIRVKKAKYFPTLVAIVQTPIYGKERRYLTPRECARLQSFPDSFILNEDDHTAYKQSGNAVNVDVVYTIMNTVIKNYEV